MYTDLHAELVYGHTGYDVTSYFRSVFIEVRKKAEMPPSTALGRILVARCFCLSHQSVRFLLSYVAVRLLPPPPHLRQSDPDRTALTTLEVIASPGGSNCSTYYTRPNTIYIAPLFRKIGAHYVCFVRIWRQLQDHRNCIDVAKADHHHHR